MRLKKDWDVGRSLKAGIISRWEVNLVTPKSHRTASYTYRVGRWFTGTFGMSSERYGHWRKSCIGQGWACSNKMSDHMQSILVSPISTSSLLKDSN